jgi:hypothetical protein
MSAEVPSSITAGANAAPHADANAKAKGDVSAPGDYSLCRTSADGSRVCIEFRRTGDRFSHTIRRTDAAGKTTDQWCEVQAGDSDDWPASPPIQELSLQRIADADVLLGVGRAGKSHWSISVETSEIDGKASLRLDIACRCPAPPQWLGSTYDVKPNAENRAPSPLTLQCEADTNAAEGQARLVIEPIDRPARWPGTVRWRFAVE